MVLNLETSDQVGKALAPLAAMHRSSALVTDGLVSTQGSADDSRGARPEAVLTSLAAALTMSIFLIDIRFPLGVAISQLYVVPVLLGLWSRSPQFPFILAAIATALSVLDLPLSLPGGVWFGAISRPLSWLILWITAAGVFRHGQMVHKLREQETLARVGGMAAVLAHEVRNPLTGLRNGLEILARHMPADSADRSAVHAMQLRIDALNELMRDVLLFASEQPIRRAIVPIRSLLESLATSLRTEFPGIDLAVELDQTITDVSGDAEQLRLALANILRNAAQAVDGCGGVRLMMRAHHRVCTIQVRDEGPGLPLTVRDRLFEPFVTTKSRGTGLGLAIARRVLEAHRGRIALSCPPDGGTLATVTLPTDTPRTERARRPAHVESCDVARRS
jgi:signal transduction histidine kinase